MMKMLLTKIAETLSGVALFCIGGVMAGIGLATVIMLATAGFVIAGLALLAAPLTAPPMASSKQEIPTDAAPAG